jgi:signal transduction histidine kinase
VLVEEQALSPAAIMELAGALREQPAWSDVPVVILTVHEPETAASRRLEEERRPLGHCVTLQWPAEPRTVASVVQTALRTRRHQCSLRDREQALARAEQALIESERLAAVGRLAASISHEINGPLEAITNLLYLIEQDPYLSTETGVYVRLASRELDRVSRIAGQTLRFHRQAPQPRRIHADELLEPVLALHKAHLRHANIDVGIETVRGARIFCFEGDIRQVLNNLVSNAVEAMPSGGRLRIRAQQCMDWRTGRRGARIAVADTGHGMSAEIAERIFSAFYTTKGIHGSGLGLWISQGLVQKHGGCIRVRSRVRQPSGTVFSFFLPEDRVDGVA